MPAYPIVLRNRVVLFQRGIALVYCGGVALMAWVAARDGWPDPARWWPYILLTFAAAGVAFLWHTLKQEVSILRVIGSCRLEVERGPAWRRVRHTFGHARPWVVDGKDSEGDPYFELKIDAPGGPLTVAEGHDRERLEQLKRRLADAIG